MRTRSIFGLQFTQLSGLPVSWWRDRYLVRVVYYVGLGASGWGLQGLRLGIPEPPRGSRWSQPGGSFGLARGAHGWVAMEMVSIQELAANSGSSWILQAPNLHFVMQLLMTFLSSCSRQNLFGLENLPIKLLSSNKINLIRHQST